jgi:hypothetical protein
MTKHGSLTEDELQFTYDLYLARLAGLAGVIKPEYLPEAHRLTERGWISRRIQDNELVFEFTDAGLVAYELAVSPPEGPDLN